MRMLLLLLPALLAAQSINEKKAALAQRGSSQETQIQKVNEKIIALRSELEGYRKKADELEKSGAGQEAYQDLLARVNFARKELAEISEGWRSAAVSEAKKDEDGYGLWDQEDATLAQIVTEYGSQDFLYVIPPEMAGIKINTHSNIPIPREAWSEVLEVILMHNGIGVKKLNPFARQLYVLKQDFGAIQTIATNEQDLAWVSGASRVFFLLSPPIEQVKSVFQFFEKFSDAKQTFVHQVGSKVALVAAKDEVVKLLSLYNTVWEGRSGKISKVVSLTKMSVREMERILTAFFNENIERSRPPFGRPEGEGLGIFPLGHSNSLVLIGSKETVERAEKIVTETEEQMQDPAEMTIHVYTCRHSDPTDLAQVLEKVYMALMHSAQEGPVKETDITVSAQSPTGRVPEGYPPAAPLTVIPTQIKSATTGHIEVDEHTTEHFIPDPKTGTLLMTVRRDVLPRVKELLKKLDIPKKMVHLEVLLFERKLNSQNNFGLNLLRLGRVHNGAQYTPLSGPAINISEGLNSAVQGVTQFFFEGPKLNSPRYDIAYNFLMSQEDVQLNAAPSVVAVNQTPAMISIVEERSINNGAAPIDTNKGTSFEKAFLRAQFGINIKITPTVHVPEGDGGTGEVTLLSDIAFDTTNSAPNNDQPLFDRRRITNEARVADGETVILGGLRRKTKRDVQEKIPFLGEIPGLGKLFGSVRMEDADTEMIFFITPKIIYDPKTQMEILRTEELKLRPGDLPEFLQKVDEARNRERNRYFEQSLKIFFKSGI